ncbi:cytochrome P450 [Apiospora saccharicola]|uniref:Cytochrome P450 n=1 Tax=Apiospora saccharicola TaxID=335842 RepID=A0ABR1VNK7_9PEZI
MNGLEVQDDMQANGSLHTRVLRVVLNSHLAALQQPLSQIVSNTLDGEFAAHKLDSKQWTELPSFALAKKTVAAANALAFFGPELASDPSFLEASLAYPEDLFLTAEVLRLIPSALHFIVAPILMRGHWASKTMVKYLEPVVEARRLRQQAESQPGAESKSSKPTDCIQFFLDSVNTKNNWTTEKIIQVLLGIWFAAVHQPAITLVYALGDLCAHPEYIEALRQEASDKVSESRLADQPLLDAFLKESCRLHPSDSISVRRKVMNPFTFQDGTRLLEGDVACVPLQAIMRGETYYSQSTQFSPARFMAESQDGASPKSASKFTDVDPHYPLWGLGRHAW